MPLVTLVIFLYIDYLTGVSAGYKKKELSSSYIRNAVCMVYVVNEILSIIENLGAIWVPIPEQIKDPLSKYASVDIADISRNWYEDICKKGVQFNFKSYDYVLEIHFNACVNDTKGNGKTTGTEIYVTTSEKGTTVEQTIVENISKLGFKNRGVKRYNWGLISHIKKQGVSAALLEVCFIDDIDDMKIYIKRKEQIAQAIVKGITQGFGIAGGNTMGKFNDISGHYAEGHIKKLTDYGIVNGEREGNFMPDKPITRADAAIMIVNALIVCEKYKKYRSQLDLQYFYY